MICRQVKVPFAVLSITRLGFEELATLTDKQPTSLMRMLSDKGNPTAANLLSVIHVLQEQEECTYLLCQMMKPR